PAFKIHRPHLIRRSPFASSPHPPCFPGPAPPSLLRQARSLQDTLKGALTRYLSVPAPVKFPDLARSPAPMRQLQAHNLAHRLFGQLIGMTLRPTRLLLHSFNSLAQKTLLPLVPSLGANPILLTQRSKIERLHRLQPKLYPLFHRFSFLPWHIRPSS